MIVVLPVCEKDKHLALLNLQLCRKLEGTCQFDCLVSSEAGFDAGEVIHAARGYFRQVFKTTYPKCQHPNKWPEVCNWAWQQAARAVTGFRQEPWLWWEQDAVPLRAGWLTDISTAYAKGGKPFAGAIVRNGVVTAIYIAGVAVYPPSIISLAPSALSVRDVPFDVAISTLDGAVTRSTDISHLIHHQFRADGGGWALNDPIPDAALYHRCSDGSLQRYLLDVGVAPSVLASSPAVDVTVVITTHNRPGRLLRALRSCWSAGVKQVVVTATGYSLQDRKTVEESAEAVPARLVWNQCDASNPAWIAGVREATTQWVHILHDDDMLLPTFLEIMPAKGAAPFAYFPAKFHRKKNAPEYLCDGPVTARGMQPTEDLLAHLLRQDTLSVTPVRGVFKREDLLRWLTTAGDSLGESCHYRPGFLVGNDLWIWLAAATTYREFYSHHSPIVSLGCDRDSTTVGDIEKNQCAPLNRMYNTARAAFLAQQPPSDQVSSTRLHIISIVLDASPWLMGQLQVFNRLRLSWHWSIVEGVAAPTHCTNWCRGTKARHSADATSDILRDLSLHDRITVYSNPYWDGKLEMVNAPLKTATRAGLVMQVDCDEFWEARQIEDAVKLFDEHPSVSNAMFWCRYFVGPGLVMEDRNCFANNPKLEWRRMWRWAPGQLFLSHEPPVMSGDQSNVLTHAVTAERGLVFDHYSYVLAQQVRFKEEYYGYHGVEKAWREMQTASMPATLDKHFPWARNGGSLKRL